MSILGIPKRTAYTPYLNFKEINEILSFLKSLPQADPSVYQAEKVSVYFETGAEQYSVFMLKADVDRNFFIAQCLGTAYETFELLDNPDNEGVLYCTNGTQAIAEGVLDCAIIGRDRPYLLKYSGTNPTWGQYMRQKNAEMVLEKHADGPFMAISDPDTTRKLVWVTLAQKKRSRFFGKVTEVGGIDFNTSGDVEIYLNGVATGVTKVACFKRLGNTGDNIAINKWVIIEWFPDEDTGAGQWFITEAQC